MPKNITIAICTYNRADILSSALESLCRQTLIPDQYEILVVDNASTDNTGDIIRNVQEKYPEHHIIGIYEVKQGLGYARNTALGQVDTPYIAYIDDDARADPNWLAIILGYIEKSTTFHCLGGPILPFYTSMKPAWFKDQYESRTWGDKIRHLRFGESLSGSNMIWHTEALRSIGGFGETVGVKGNTLSVGEETIAFHQLWQRIENPVVIYDPNLVIYHWVPPNKMRINYPLKRAFVVGQVAILVTPHSNLLERFRIALRSGGAVILYGLRAVFRFTRYQHWQNWVIEECQLVASKMGTSLAAFGINIDVTQ